MGAQIDDGDIKYTRVEYQLLFHAKDFILSNIINTDLVNTKNDYQYKSIDISPQNTLIVLGGLQYQYLRGILIFENDDEAIAFSNKLNLYIDDTRIIYSEILISQNNNHIKNPQPDLILSRNIKGVFPGL